MIGILRNDLVVICYDCRVAYRGLASRHYEYTCPKCGDELTKHYAVAEQYARVPIVEAEEVLVA